MKNFFLIMIPCMLLSFGCKKNYTCECRNSFGVYEAGSVYGTKKKSEDKCNSLSTSDTHCYAK